MHKLLAALLVLLCSSTLASAQAHFDECGVIVAGSTTGCPKFFAVHGTTYLLDDYGTFQVGDTLRVQGALDPGCLTLCIVSNGGCVTVSNLGSCGPGNSASPFCFGDGVGAACPCANHGAMGQGCANSTGAGASLTASGSDSVAADDLAFSAGGMLAGQPSLLFSGLTALNGGNGVVFGDGLRCTGGIVLRHSIAVPNGLGDAAWPSGLASAAGIIAGDTRHFQGWYRDPSSSPCGSGFNLTHGVSVNFTP
ncbi:MAG: hypothetical protein ABGY71_03930 [bacterium]|jgi:hypothetical protein|nr:hypothetical protein [Planctomycetota bacterium]HIL51751.1 hypothetical protein [Planctomycetota bacterium]